MNVGGEICDSSEINRPEMIPQSSSRIGVAPQPPVTGSTGQNLYQHYKTIGETLLIIEAATAYGIPVLFPTGRVRNRRKSYYPTLSDFMRSSLISVPTFALESYVEDLIEPSENILINYDLQIAEVSLVERWGLGLIVLSLAFGLSLLIGLLSQTELFSSLSIAVGIGLILALIYHFSSDDKSRRSSFASVLKREIRRRKGQDSKHLTPMALCLRAR